MELSADLLQAEQLDAEGNHQDAVKCLVSAIGKGDLVATTRLGKRMIVGDRAPNLPKDGVGFVVQAAEQGEPEALCLLSVLFALGMFMRQDWQQALNALRLSAEKGWQPAQKQLQVLTTNRKLAAQDSHGKDHWLALARAVDFNYWNTGVPANMLSESPVIKTFPDFISKEVCQWLIEKSRDKLTRALVYDSVKRTVTQNHTRTNSAAIFNMVETDLVNLLLQSRMSASTQMPFRQFEAATVLHYAPGEQISEHYDFIDPATPDYAQVIQQQGQRVITFIIYLNDSYELGETVFPELGISHKGSRGEGIYFVNSLTDGSPDKRTLHAGRPPQQGDKWIATQFIRNRNAL